ncbi:Arginine--tRNA ligase [Bienertia sinuspersici]
MGNKIGRFIKVDKSESIGIDKSLRMRVLVDVRKPLIQKIKIKIRGVENYYDIKYEKPPLFCFFCGKRAHGTKDCEESKEMDEPVLKYGLWLKASPWKTVSSEVDKEKNNKSKCACNLFFTKPN